MSDADGLSLETLKSRTARAHVLAEKSGIVADLLRRRANHDAFALFLRNLTSSLRTLDPRYEPTQCTLIPKITSQIDPSPLKQERWQPCQLRAGKQHGNDAWCSLGRLFTQNRAKLLLLPLAQP